MPGISAYHFHIHLHTLAGILHLLVWFWLVRRSDLYLREYPQFAHNSEQAFRAAGIAPFAKPLPQFYHSKRGIPSPHIPDKIQLGLGVLVRVMVRTSGLAGQRFHTSIPARLPKVDIRPAFVIFPAGPLTPYFAAYCMRDCRYRMSCVILLLMRDRVPFLGLVVCGNLTIPYEGSVLLLFYSLLLALLSNMYCSSTASIWTLRTNTCYSFSSLLYFVVISNKFSSVLYRLEYMCFLEKLADGLSYGHNRVLGGNIRLRRSHSNSIGNKREKDTAGCCALNRKDIVIEGY